MTERRELLKATRPQNKANSERVFVDVASGRLADRPGLARAPDFVREGDEPVVWKPDRRGQPGCGFADPQGCDVIRVALPTDAATYVDTPAAGGFYVESQLGYGDPAATAKIVLQKR